MTAKSRFSINSNLRWFMFAMIMANIAAQMCYSMLSLYLVDLGTSVAQVGLVFTLASLVPVALQVLGGWLSDTIGRLRAIALGSCISVFGYLIFAMSPSWQWVLIGLSLDYVSSSVVGPSYSAYIAEQSSEEERGRVFGVTKSVYMIVMVIGPALGGLLAYRFGFRAMLLVAFLCYVCATGLRIWMALSERFASSKKAQRPTLAGLRSEMGAMLTLLFAGGLLTWIWVTDAISDTAGSLTYQLFPIYLSDVGGMNVAQVGVLNAARGVAIVAASLVSGWLTDRYGERAVITVGFLGEALGLAAVLQASGFAGLLEALAAFGLGIGCLMPAYDSMVSKAVPEERRGLAFGFFGTSLGILSLPFPWIGAQLWERFSPQVPFWITAAALAASIPIVLLKFVLPKDRDAAGSAPREPAA